MLGRAQLALNFTLVQPEQRHIPETTKLRVRQECYFGCVICGALPYDYDHFGTPFKDAGEHDAQQIALLCVTCHREKTSGRLPDREVAGKRHAPYNKGRDIVYRAPLSSGDFRAKIPGWTATSPECASFVCNGGSLFGAYRGADDRWRFSADLRGLDGRTRLVMHDNEVRVAAGVWDVKLEGKELTVRSSRAERVAVIVFDPENYMVSVRRLRMSLGAGWQLDGTDDTMKVLRPGRSVWGTVRDCHIENFSGSSVVWDLPVQFPAWPYR